MEKARSSETIQRLAGVELTEPRLIDEARDVALPVNQPHERLLLDGELGTALLEPVPVDIEHDVEARNLLLDQAPLVHAPRALEQQRLRVDRHEKSCSTGALRHVERLALEWSTRLRDPQPDVAMQLFTRDTFALDEDLAEPLVALRVLHGHALIELRLRDEPVLDENVAEAVAPVHDRRVADAALVEVDVAEALPMSDARQPLFFPIARSWRTSGRLASFRLPLIAISAVPR